MTPNEPKLRPLDDPDASLADLARDAPPGWFGDHNEILKEVTMRMSNAFGVVMPFVTLSIRAGHPSQKWSAWCTEFHCGWYGATPREALATVVDHWYEQDRAYALERVRRMSVAMDDLDRRL